MSKNVDTSTYVAEWNINISQLHAAYFIILRVKRYIIAMALT